MQRQTPRGRVQAREKEKEKFHNTRGYHQNMRWSNTHRLLQQTINTSHSAISLRSFGVFKSTPTSMHPYSSLQTCTHRSSRSMTSTSNATIAAMHQICSSSEVPTTWQTSPMAVNRMLAAFSLISLPRFIPSTCVYRITTLMGKQEKDA
ncbi:hypothetical protein O6H91_19G085800 [Diphasiastrum complanatum]|uniref:Uncharacterized protein n=1 Tax=Diphasiastrum complanatum TaxID=34168 RepID=A0ACC2AY81_DIPCM|nr:hypothetical protein O6H91_19G085800 [Diphasiastrum complanatum]